MDEADLNSKLEDVVVVPVIVEELQVGVRQVPTGGVRIHKHVTEHEEAVDQLLHSEHVEVRRVVRNEVVTGPLPVRHEGETMIVPVVKEVLKIEKQFVLTEELHITKRITQERHAERVMLRQEQADIERIDAAGNAVQSPAPPTPSSTPVLKPQESLLGPSPKFPVRRNKILTDD